MSRRRITPYALEQTYPRFYAGLRALGPTNPAIAERLGVEARTVWIWMDGKGLPTVKTLQHWPDGLRLLADDLEARNGTD